MFNADITAWDTSSGTTMENMFNGCTAFNQPLHEKWVTASVRDVKFMFNSCSSFNQPVGSWITSSVTDYTAMFSEASVFNQPLTSWTMATPVADGYYVMDLKRETVNKCWVNSKDEDDVYYPKGGTYPKYTRKHVEAAECYIRPEITMNSMFYKAVAFSQDVSHWIQGTSRGTQSRDAYCDCDSGEILLPSGYFADSVTAWSYLGAQKPVKNGWLQAVDGRSYHSLKDRKNYAYSGNWKQQIDGKHANAGRWANAAYIKSTTPDQVDRRPMNNAKMKNIFGDATKMLARNCKADGPLFYCDAGCGAQSKNSCSAVHKGKVREWCSDDDCSSCSNSCKFGNCPLDCLYKGANSSPTRGDQRCQPACQSNEICGTDSNGKYKCAV